MLRITYHRHLERKKKAIKKDKEIQLVLFLHVMAHFWKNSNKQ